MNEANVRLVVGLMASLTLFVLILADALVVGYSLSSTAIVLLAGFIWSCLGIDVFARRAPQIMKDYTNGDREKREDDE